MQEIEWESLFRMFLDCILSFIRMAYARESPEGFQDGGILAEFTKKKVFPRSLKAAKLLDFEPFCNPPG